YGLLRRAHHVAVLPEQERQARAVEDDALVVVAFPRLGEGLGLERLLRARRVLDERVGVVRRLAAQAVPRDDLRPVRREDRGAGADHARAQAVVGVDERLLDGRVVAPLVNERAVGRGEGLELL